MQLPATEAEREILAAIATEPELFRLAGLTGVELRTPFARVAWDAAARLSELGRLTSAGLVDALPTADAKSWLMDAVANACGGSWRLEEHVAQVVDRWRCAELERIGLKTAGLARSEMGCDEVLADLASDLVALELGSKSDGSEALGDVAFAELESIESGEAVAGVGWGLRTFDKADGSVMPGEVTIVAARPGMGKTALLVQGAEHAAQVDECQVLFISAEMLSRLLSWRFLARMSGVSIGAFRKRAFSKSDWGAVYAAAAKLKKLPITIVDEIPSIQALWSTIHRWALRHSDRRKAVYVDYLQRLPIRQQKGQTKDDAIGEVSWGFCELAKKYGMPIVLAAQLNRKVEEQDRKPMPSDLRDSGNIEQDASQIIFPWRPDIYNDPRKAELIVAKNRNGEAGICRDLDFDPQTGCFKEVDTYNSGDYR